MAIDFSLSESSLMAQARALYDDLGFREIPPYYHNPHPEVSYLELDLTGP